MVALIELISVFCIIYGISCIAALLNQAFRALPQPFFFAVVAAFTLLLSFFAGGLLKSRGIGRGTIIFAGIVAYFVSALSFLFDRGLVAFPLQQITRVDLGIAVSVNFSFFLWILLFILLAFWIKSKRLRSWYTKMQKIVIPGLVLLATCGVISVIALIAAPQGVFGHPAIPAFDYSVALQQRASAYQKEHYAWQVIPDEEVGDVKMQTTERLGRIWSYNFLLFGASSRLENAPFSVCYNPKYDIWFVETHPHQPLPQDGQDHYTHLLVRGSDGLVLAKW